MMCDYTTELTHTLCFTAQSLLLAFFPELLLLVLLLLRMYISLCSLSPLPPPFHIPRLHCLPSRVCLFGSLGQLLFLSHVLYHLSLRGQIASPLAAAGTAD